jgi:hypothetical protein
MWGWGKQDVSGKSRVWVGDEATTVGETTTVEQRPSVRRRQSSNDHR